MKKTMAFLILIVSMFCFGGAWGAEDSKNAQSVTVDITKLSQSQLIEFQKLKKMEGGETILDSVKNMSVDDTNKYMAIGKSFGLAFKECWTTVSTDAERFGNSPAGKVTMFLIAWKIMAKDLILSTHLLVGYLVGFGLLIVLIPTWIYLFRKHCLGVPCVKSKKRGWMPWQVEVEYFPKKDDFDSDGRSFAYYGALIFIIIIACFCMFGSCDAILPPT